jgi:biopolymer transport protein ExbD
MEAFMRRLATSDTAIPIAGINTTPLIDVLLVLLVMFIITIPIQTHAVKLDLPTGPPPSNTLNPVVNELGITRAGIILWNGAPMSENRLGQVLQLTQQMNPVPELHLRPEAEARYEKVDQVLAIIKREHVEKVGFVGNEAYAIH